MSKWGVTDIMQALGLVSTGQIEFEATGISIDSRTLKPGEIFVAVQGDSFDGHEFLQAAFNRGAAGFIISQSPPDFLKNHTYFVVPDTLKALRQLATYSRARSKAKVVAITGSAGKTTTKEWLAQTLGAFGSTVYSPASYNNHVGVPLSLASLNEDTAFGVFEIGMNHEGEIEPLARLVQHDIAIITTIAESHIGHLKTLDKIAAEKATIFAGLKQDGTAILNYDNDYFDFLARVATGYGAGKIVKVGQKQGSDVHLVRHGYDSKTDTTLVEAHVNGNPVQYKLSLVGDHYVMNSLMVLATANCLGLNLDKVVKELENLKPIGGRGQKHTVCIAPNKTITLIDDAYNAQPSSMQAGLTALTQLPSGRRIAVLGEMRELGDDSATFHKDLLPFVQRANVDLLFACAGDMKLLLDCLPSAQQGGYSEQAEDLWKPLLDSLQNGDIVFIKGSKSTRVSILVHRLLSLHQDVLSSQLEVA